MLYKIRNFLFGSKIKRACANNDTILDRILDWFSDKYTDFIIVPYETTCRFFYWGWKLRKNYSWDCSHNTYYMLHLKFQNLIDYSRKYGHLCWNSKENGKEFRKLKIACELCKKLYEDDYNTYMDMHNKKWGEPVFDWLEKDNEDSTSRRMQIERPNANTDELKKQEIKEFRIAHKRDEHQKQIEREYLFYILNKYMEGWWD